MVAVVEDGRGAEAAVADAAGALAEQDAHAVESRVPDGDIQDAVFVEVGHRDRKRLGRCGEVARRTKRPIAKAVKHRDQAGVVTGRHQIGVPVSVEISRGDPCRDLSDRIEGRRGKGAITYAAAPAPEQHGNRGAGVVREREIRDPVVVEIARDDIERSVAGGIAGGGLKSAVAPADQDGDVAARNVGDREIQVCVVIEVTGRETEWLRAGSECRRRAECPVSDSGAAEA